MAPAIAEQRAACDACGHAATQHSNEACEAIRCSCRVTRKLLASKAVARATVKRAVPPVTGVPAEPVQRPKKRTRARAAIARAGDTAA